MLSVAETWKAWAPIDHRLAKATKVKGLKSTSVSSRLLLTDLTHTCVSSTCRSLVLREIKRTPFTNLHTTQFATNHFNSPTDFQIPGAQLIKADTLYNNTTIYDHLLHLFYFIWM